MLTQSAPAIVNALSGALPDNVVKALLQAVGNCNQPLTHRGPVNLSANPQQQNGPGTYGGGAWNPADYGDLLPNVSERFDADIPGWDSPWGWNTSNFLGDTFNFPSSQEFTLNNFYGGPTFFSGGNSSFETVYNINQTTENHVVNNLTVNTINGEPVQGPAGPPGIGIGIGIQGRPGNPGQDGQNARLPPAKPLNFVRSLFAKRSPLPGQIVTGVTFNPDTCEVEVERAQLFFTPDIAITPGAVQYYGP